MNTCSILKQSLAKIKVVTAAILLAGVLGTGTGLVSVRLLAIGPSSAPQETADLNARQQAPAPPANREPAAPAQVQTSALLERALQAIPTVENPNQRVWILCEIAKLQTRAGLRDAAVLSLRQAIEVSEGLRNKDYRSHRLADIAASQAEMGDVKGAFEMVDLIAQTGSRRRWYVSVGQEKDDTTIVE